MASIDFTTGIGSAFEFAKGLLDRFWPAQASEAEKMEAVAQLVPAIEARDDKVIEAQKSIIVAEMQQGDLYTKRARPSVVYFGLAFIGLVHVVAPIAMKLVIALRFGALTPEQLAGLEGLTSLSLPGEFWIAWGSVVSIWSIGRSAERRGLTGQVLEMINGKK